MATLHLMSGLPCSGKTTYARALSVDLNCVLFTLDRWLITAFEKYRIADVGHPEHVRRVLACRELIWDSASELLTRGVDVILDDGFFFRENRMQVVAEARALGAGAKIHYLKVPLPELQARLASRNASLPQFNFLIDPQTLDAFIDMFEVPSADEGGEVVVIQGDAIDSGASSG